MQHELKIKVEYLLSIVSGFKLFEIRKHDRSFMVNDTIKFKSVADGSYYDVPIYEITYILADFEGLAPGYVCLGIKPC